MAKTDKIFVFTDADMDGAGSYLVLTWLLGAKVPYIVAPSNTFREAFLEWQKLHKLTDYEKIFILDLDVSEHIDLVDQPNVVIVDHHSSHFPNKSKYTKAKVIVEEATSACLLLYKRLKEVAATPLTEAQKLLILLVDDYDSYQFKLPQTYSVNTLFWNFQGDRVSKFCDRWQKGFDLIDDGEKSIVAFYKKRLERIQSELSIFVADIPVGEKSYKFTATFATEYLNDIAQYILQKTGAEVALVINSKTQKVSFRRTREGTFNVAKLAERIADGGGHEFSAGGVLNDKVLAFSKLFSPYDQH